MMLALQLCTAEKGFPSLRGQTMDESIFETDLQNTLSTRAEILPGDWSLPFLTKLVAVNTVGLHLRPRERHEDESKTVVSRTSRKLGDYGRIVRCANPRGLKSQHTSETLTE
jgi:hypothetical protein